MAKPHQYLNPEDVTREQLLGIPGVGTRNISNIEEQLDKHFANGGTAATLTPEALIVSGTVSSTTAADVVSWIQRHVAPDLQLVEDDAPAEQKTQPEIVSNDKIFEGSEDDEEVQWETNGHAPVFALAFDPAEAISKASLILEDYPDAPHLHHQLDAVIMWLRGEVEPYQKA